ncbi:MAG TPA: outer membrane beta-barrel protein [Stellaceae bacterium]
MLTRCAYLVGTMLTLAALLPAPEAQAQLAQPATMNVGRAYVGVSPGVIIPNDLHGTFSGGLVGSGDISFKAGPTVTGFIGYHFNDVLAGEGELGFATFDEDKFSGTFNGVPVSASIDGRIDSFVAFGNLIVTPLGRSGFAPYIGGGVGVASLDQKINSINGVAVNTSSSESHFAANLMLGFDIAVARRWSVGGRYRFLWVNASSTDTSGGVTTKQDDFTAHVLTATATFHF